MRHAFHFIVLTIALVITLVAFLFTILDDVEREARAWRLACCLLWLASIIAP